MPSDKIVVRGAREHNLRNLDVEMPRDRLIVITGLSGSGKSSLAFDTIYAEGQRRYVESLSAYARQFLGQMEKPDVDQIDGLSPAISIDQKGASKNPRSTVGTVTEIYDYLRLLFARIGRMHCPICGREIERQTVEQMVDQVYELPEGTRVLLLAPLVRDRKGEHEKLLAGAKQAGFVRVRVDGEVRDLDEEIALDKKYKHSIEVVVDRLVVRQADDHGTPRPDASRMADSIETALRLSDGTLLVHLPDAPKKEQDRVFSERYAWVKDRFGVSWQIGYFGNQTPQPITPTLLFVGDVCGKAEEAMRFYTSVFKDANMRDITRYGAGDTPEVEGTVMYGEFTLQGQVFVAMDSAQMHDFTFTEAISLLVRCEDQAEVDYFWDALSAVPEAEACGWLKDKYGVSWQIVPQEMIAMMESGDPEKIANAKDIVEKALIGLGLLITAAVILKTINPATVNPKANPKPGNIDFTKPGGGEQRAK